MASTSRFGRSGYVMGGGFALLGTVLLAYGAYLFSQAAASPAWPRAEGRILTSRVQPGVGRRSRNRAEITYEFSARGATIRGSRIQAANVTGFGTESARTTLNRYPAGKTVTVSYDPDDPTFALLEPGVTFGAYVMPGIGLAFLFGGLLFLWLSYREQTADP